MLADPAWLARKIGAHETIDVELLISAGIVERYTVLDNRPRKILGTETDRERERKDLGGEAVFVKSRAQNARARSEELKAQTLSLEERFKTPEPDPSDRNPRSLSIPKDPETLYQIVTEFMLTYWPEERVGAGMPMAVRTWQGTIPDFTRRVAALKRELETRDYGKNGLPVRWHELPFERRRGEIALSLNTMQRAARG